MVFASVFCNHFTRVVIKLLTLVSSNLTLFFRAAVKS